MLVLCAMCIFLCKLVLIGLRCTCFWLSYLSLQVEQRILTFRKKFMFQGPGKRNLEKGSEANVTEDGGNNSMELDYEKLFKEVDDDNTSAVEHEDLKPWIPELTDGNTSAGPQGRQWIKASKNGNTSTAARGGLDWEQRIQWQKFQALDDCNTSAMAQGEPPKHVDEGAGSGSTFLAVLEGMLNEQASLPPVREINFRSVSSTVAHLPPSRIPIKVVVRGRWADKHQYKFHVEPNEHVTVLRELLAAQSAHLPPDYHFSSNRTVMDEFMSFRDNGIVGVGVPEIEVVYCTAKLPTDQV